MNLFRRIQHEINTLRGQLKHQSLEHIASNDDRYRIPIHANLRQDVARYPMRRAGSMETTNRNPYFEDELQGLLKRKNQMEIRIRRLQQSREELTSQLDHLERSFSSYNMASFRSYSTPATPVHHRLTSHCRINN